MTSRDGGGERWIGEKATVSRGRSGEVARITGAIIDISDLKRTEAALDSIEGRYEPRPSGGNGNGNGQGHRHAR